MVRRSNRPHDVSVTLVPHWITPLLLSLLLILSWPAHAADLHKSIYLSDTAGAETAIGTLTLTPAGDGWYRYSMHIDHSKFTDHFLSMKEMKCLEGKELWCHVPYPYDNPRQISRDDLRWLEHDLLFLFKRPGEFGARLWNGIYYPLSWQDDVLSGDANAMDLNILASPPEDLTTPPIGEYDIDPVDPAARWLPHIEIR